MKIKIKLLRPYSEIVGKKELEIDFNGSTLNDLLNYLVDKFPNLKNELYTKNDELTEYVCIFVNDKPASALNELETKIKEGDEILFFVPLSGG
jgi:MoaD family protein